MDSAPFPSSTFPKDSAGWSCGAAQARSARAGSGLLGLGLSLAVFSSASSRPTCSRLPFPPPHQALLWFWMISPLFNHSGEIGPKIENKRMLTWVGSRPARTTPRSSRVLIAALSVPARPFTGTVSPYKPAQHLYPTDNTSGQGCPVFGP